VTLNRDSYKISFRGALRYRFCEFLVAVIRYLCQHKNVRGH